jgi:hypothetical protein
VLKGFSANDMTSGQRGVRACAGSVRWLENTITPPATTGRIVNTPADHLDARGGMDVAKARPVVISGRAIRYRTPDKRL